MTRTERLTELEVESRRYLASYVLFNQAMADQVGLHPTDLQCINLLTIEPGPFTTGRIAELTGLTSGSATRLVDRLERAGYVTRERDAADRRRVLVVPVAAAVRPARRGVGRTQRRLGGDVRRLHRGRNGAAPAAHAAHHRAEPNPSTAATRPALNRTCGTVLAPLRPSQDLLGELAGIASMVTATDDSNGAERTDAAADE